MSDKYTNHFPTGLKISSLIFSAILLTNILASLFFADRQRLIQNDPVVKRFNVCN